MSQSSARPGDSTRRVVALDIITDALPPTWGAVRSDGHQDAHPAFRPVDAIGMLKASLHFDGEFVRAAFENVIVLSVTEHRGEEAILQGFAQEMERLGRPLLVTAGGRRGALPILRYRALARGVPLRFLRTVAGTAAYFARDSVDWHLDLEEVLAGQAAVPPLPLQALCWALGIDLSEGDGPQRPENTLTARLTAIYVIYLRYMHLIGSMHHCALVRALEELKGGVSPTTAETPSKAEGPHPKSSGRNEDPKCQ